MADGNSNDLLNGSNKRKAVTNDERSAKKLKETQVAKHGISQELKVISYANSHAFEIKALRDSVQVTLGGKLITQKLPRHMRRRAMSHNIKRIPRKIQPYAQGVYANQKGLVRKRPSRYHRRRPKNLLQEYNRRNRKNIWLETHIWHAKRFHMVEKWGFKLPWKPTDKSHRAAYRATKNHCLLQDLSYTCCIELSGYLAHLIERLSHVTSTETGQTFASKACLNGTREGQTVLYEIDQYPWKAIGPVNFMWNPSLIVDNKQQGPSDKSKVDGSSRRMWIWCHPCIFDSVWNEFVKCFELTEQKLDVAVKLESIKSVVKETINSSKKGVDGNAGKPCITDKYKTDIIATNNTRKISMKSLTGSILRYRLTGPQSTTVLVDALTQANIRPVNDATDETDPWWKSFYAREDMALNNGAQRQFIESLIECQSPAELSPHCILASTVQDPRLGRPTKRTKIESKEDSITTDSSVCRLKVTPDLADSPLWNDKIRDEVKQTKQPDYKISELKHELLVPGTVLELGDSESKIPVILIQRPGVTSGMPTGHDPCPGHGSGWDLLLPEGWGMPFWLALVFRGARCGGLMEQECSVYEERMLLFPNNYPDTLSGLTHQSNVEDTLLVKYNRTPPAKRPNFTKLGVPFPYNSAWSILTEHWNGSTCPVDRNGNIPKTIRSKVTEVVDERDQMETSVQEQEMQYDESETKTQVIGKHVQQNPETSKNRNYFVLRNYKVLRQLHSETVGKSVRHRGKQLGIDHSVFYHIEKSYQTSLVPVRVELMGRGVVQEFATICIPNTEDLASIVKDKRYGGPMEPKHVDPKLVQKKKLKSEMKDKKVKKKVKIDRILKKVDLSQDFSLDSCSRNILGFVCTGGFSLGTGTGGGVGFVSVKGLVALIRSSGTTDHKSMVLVRNNTSLQYRYARLSVLL